MAAKPGLDRSVSDSVRVSRPRLAPDGHALETLSADGTPQTAEVSGSYGQRFSTLSSGTWPIDGFHGSDPDGGLSHMGARHMRVGDGLWLQPEPLLYLGMTNGEIDKPLFYGGVYAAGRPWELADRTGYAPGDADKAARNAELEQAMKTAQGGGVPAGPVLKALGYQASYLIAKATGWSPSSLLGTTAGAAGPGGSPGLTVTGSQHNAAELQAASAVAEMGRSVELRDPVTDAIRSSSGDTADLLVDGVPMDIYSPQAGTSVKNVLRGIEKKNNQAQGVVLDLAAWDGDASALGDVRSRVQGKIEGRGGTMNLTEVIVVHAGGE